MMGIDKYIKLAKYYNISIDYLVGLVSIPKPISENPSANNHANIDDQFTNELVYEIKRICKKYYKKK